MKISKQDKAEIRACYPWYSLRFRKDGSVLARPPFSSDRAWGLLYTPEQTAAHIKAFKRMNEQLNKIPYMMDKESEWQENNEPEDE